MGAPLLPQLLLGHWQPAWPLDAEAILMAALYPWAVRRARRRWPARRTVSFLAGLACLVIALQSGVGSFDDRLLSAHMVQHLLLLVVAPVLLLTGRPQVVMLHTLRPGSRRGAVRSMNRLRPFTRPVSCLGIFSAVVLLTHLPAVYQVTLADKTLHEGEHGLFLLAGLLVWWPILDGDPARSRRLGGLGKLIYLLAAMLPMAVVGAWLNRTADLAYPAYAAPARALGVSALADQSQAGAIMWVAGGTAMVAVGLWATMSALIEDERRQRARDARAAALLGRLAPPLDPRVTR